MEVPRADKVATCLRTCTKYNKCYLADFSLNEINKSCLLYGYPIGDINRTKYSHLRNLLNEIT